MRGLMTYFRANPQVLLLVLVCLILGLGTFVAIMIALVGAHGGQYSGDPSGIIAWGTHGLAGWLLSAAR